MVNGSQRMENGVDADGDACDDVFHDASLVCDFFYALAFLCDALGEVKYFLSAHFHVALFQKH